MDDEEAAKKARQRRTIEAMNEAIAALMAEADADEREAARKRALAAGLESRLRGDDTDDTIRDMNVDTRGKSEAVKRAVGRATRKHPAQEAFYRAGVTIGQVAKELGEGRPRVSSWMADGDGCRPIPRRHVVTLKERYHIPASAWARIKD